MNGLSGRLTREPSLQQLDNHVFESAVAVCGPHFCRKSSIYNVLCRARISGSRLCGTESVPSFTTTRSHRACFGVSISICFLALGSGEALADPWLAPGDLAMRHDIELLADAGILHGPVMTWPMSWPDIARDVTAAGEESTHGDAVDAALARVRRAAGAAAAPGYSGVELAGGIAAHPTELRTFAATPRESDGVSAAASWLTDHFAARAQVAVVAEPSDKQTVRLDGSYVGVNVGNFMISAGAMERWWGPGWDGSLILSTNARPIPTVTVERNDTEAFKTPWLRWIGPWRGSFSLGRTENDTTARDGILPVRPKVNFMEARLDFRPRPWLEIALSRTAQFCGQGRICTLKTFENMLIGNDNQVTASGISPQQPGNQLAGYDFRLTSPWRHFPVAIYSQFIGEDEAGHLPSKFLGLVGGETWGNTRWGSFRLRGEYADTACEFSRHKPAFDCAYRNGIYPQGYSYRGRIIGDAMDGDGRMYSFSALLVRSTGDSFSLLARRVDLNRGGSQPEPAQALAVSPAKLKNVELQYNRGFALGQISVGLGFDKATGTVIGSAGKRAFLQWRQGF